MTITDDAARGIGTQHYVTGPDRTALRVSSCTHCGSVWFPARSQCSECASWEVTETLTGNSGVVYASTVVRIGPSGFAAPYVLAYIDVDGVRVLTHVADGAEALTPGSDIRLVEAPIASDAQGPLLSYAVRVQQAGLDR